MRPAVEFAELNGFATDFTQGGHLVFSGYGRQVFAAGTPSSPRAALIAVSKMKRILREQAGLSFH